MIFSEKKCINVAMAFLCIYSYFEFIFSYTNIVTEEVSSVFTIITFLLVLFAFLNSKIKIVPYRFPINILMIFIIYMLFHFIVARSYGNIIIYISLFLLICLCSSKEDASYFPERFLALLSLFFSIGVLFQFLFPNAYSNVFLPILKTTDRNAVLMWQNKGLYAGFTHQIGTSATYICYGIFLQMNKKKFFAKPVFNVLYLLLLYFCLFLTGKRMLLLISVAVPLFVFLISEQGIRKSIKRILMILLILIIFGIFFYSNLDYLSSLGGGIGRIADTFIGLQEGRELDEHRNQLIDYAIYCFRLNPVFGVGWGNFLKITGSRTLAHNALFQLLAETGIIGAGLFLITIFSFLFYSIKKIKKIGKKSCNYNDYRILKMSLYFQLCFIINSLTENTLNSIYCFGIYMIFLCLAIAYNNNGKIINSEIDGALYEKNKNIN